MTIAGGLSSQADQYDSWSGQQDSNLRPSAPKADALPDCAMPRATIHQNQTPPRPSPGDGGANDTEGFPGGQLRRHDAHHDRLVTSGTAGPVRGHSSFHHKEAL